MNIYPRELNSLKALEQEKKRLNRQLDELNKEELFSLSALTGKRSGDSEKAGGFDISSLIGMLPISNPFIATLLPIIQKRLFKTVEDKLTFKKTKIDKVRVAGPVDEEALHHTVMHKVKKAAGSVAKEVILGYLKWKAIELAFKGTRHLIKKQQEKKRASRETAAF